MSAIASYLRRVLACFVFVGIMSILPIHAVAPEYRIAYLVANEVTLNNGSLIIAQEPEEQPEPEEKQTDTTAQEQDSYIVPEIPRIATSAPTELVPDKEVCVQQSAVLRAENTAASSVGGQSPTTHVVTKGETLSGIAAKYKMTVQQISALNGITNPNMIRPGQTLLLAEKPPEPRKHTVKSGENLSFIAAHYGVAVSAIVQINQLADVNRLKVGQVLEIPPAEKATLASRSAISAAGMIWPVIGQISSYFGPRWGTQHTGLDIAAPTGTDIKAVRAGRVELAGWWGGYGNCVIIDHGDGLKTLYAHASRLLVKRGDRVIQGQVIAKVGSTGNSTGPHVHFEVRVNDKFMDPLKYMPK